MTPDDTLAALYGLKPVKDVIDFGGYRLHSIEEFKEILRWQCWNKFYSDSGMGVWATEKYYVDGTTEKDLVHPSMIRDGDYTVPHWATHVLWWNTEDSNHA